MARYNSITLVDKVIRPDFDHQFEPGKAARGDVRAWRRTLSGRETETLKLICWGYANKEIAAYFKRSVKTVEAHKTNGMLKLNFRNRRDLMAWAVGQGWLTQENQPTGLPPDKDPVDA